MTAAPDQAWRLRAHCADTDPNLFFAVNKHVIEQAKAVCEDCPVRAACLAYAIGTNASGVWGGTDEDERHKMGGPRIVPVDARPVQCSECPTMFVRNSSSHRTCSEQCKKVARRKYRRGWDKRRRESEQERESA